MKWLRNWLQHPLTRGMDLDDPGTTTLRKQIIIEKRLLRSIYEEWYATIRNYLPAIHGPVLEIGSGAGFLKTRIPELITSDLMPIAGNNLCCNAQRLPFSDQCLKALVLVNVLHHIASPMVFLGEAERCIKHDGSIVLIEPWVTTWSNFIYSRFHHEPFDPASNSWNLPEAGPLSGGNDALAWIMFKRDQEHFNRQTNWKIDSIEEIMPFRYLLSGGVSMRSLVPEWMTTPLKKLEMLIPPRVMARTAMFAVIVLKKDTT